MKAGVGVVWAFDPGTTTGVAVWHIHDHKLHEFSGQYTITELYTLVDEWCMQIDPVQVELFTITAATIRKARVSDPLDVIGYLKYAAWRCGWTVSWSKPADVMQRYPDAALKKAKLFTPGKGHQNDAARHLAGALVRLGHMDAKELLL